MSNSVNRDSIPQENQIDKTETVGRGILQDSLKGSIQEHFEIIFIVLILLTSFLIYYFVPQKLSLLDFYYLPIILCGYYLGRRTAVLGAFMSALTMLLFVLVSPGLFLTKPSTLYLYLHIVAWGCFLILAGAAVGGLQEKLVSEINTTRNLNEKLQSHQDELNRANNALRDYSDTLERKVDERTEALNRANISLREHSENLEHKVRERTEELEKSKEALESLKSKVEMALYSTMDSSVVKLLIEGRLRNEKRNVSILFSDLVGFSTYSEGRPPEIVIRYLNRYIADMEPILLAYRGHIDRYMGDAILCEFGAPLDYATYRLMAVLAAIKMQQRMQKMDYPWQLRIGVSSGTTIIGLVGSKRQAYTAIGDVVNISSRLQSACEPGGVLIDRYTYETVSRFIDARKKRDLSTKDMVDVEKEFKLEELHQKMAIEPDNAVYYYEIGQIHLAMNEPFEALQYFDQAMQRDPENTKLKLAYAEASLKIHEYEKINIRGRRQRIEAYEVIGIKDPLTNRDKVTPQFTEKYGYIADLLQIPEDVLLPVEALDSGIGHGKMVAIFAYAIAENLGLAEKEKTDILHAGYVADIGKEIVPHHLLNRQGPLNSREMDIIKAHPIEGTIAVRNMGYENENMLRYIRHSHENYDGSGYPDGLKGLEIPLGSRIIAVADAYDALISWRPYRDPWERTVALDEII
jgi:HD-GYP domain-containing protein (c-di-GMP phosphodiesterase class II)